MATMAAPRPEGAEHGADRLLRLLTLCQCGDRQDRNDDDEQQEERQQLSLFKHNFPSQKKYMTAGCLRCRNKKPLRAMRNGA
jgi:hypothetical protein